MSEYKSWREHCKPIISEVIETVGTDDMKTLRKALKEAYPYGERNYWPYKVWCDEIRIQLGLKGLKGERQTDIEGQRTFL